ncbi:MAG: biotin/lipoyl-containing protein [Thermoplasmata archaeon]
MHFRLVVDGEAHDVELERSSRGLLVRVDGATYRARVEPGEGGFRVRVGSGRHRIVIRQGQFFVDGQPHDVVTEIPEEAATSLSPSSTGTRGAVLEVRPPMPGRVVRLVAIRGAVVKRGQTLAVLEAMKMQNEIASPADALVTDVRVREGEWITTDRVIAVLETR